MKPDNLTIKQKADLFDALMNQQRIIIESCNGVGEEKYQHIKLEMWTRHLSAETEECKDQTKFGRTVLNQYLSTHARSIKRRGISISII